MLRPLPDDFVATRLAMHRVAEDGMKPAREAVTGRFGLRARPGGFGTPPFGDVVELYVDGVELVERRGSEVVALGGRRCGSGSGRGAGRVVRVWLGCAGGAAGGGG